MQKYFVVRPTSFLCSVVATAAIVISGNMVHAADDLSVSTTADEVVATSAEATQDSQTAQSVQREDRGQNAVHWGFDLGGAYQARTDIDGGGDLSVSRFAATGSAIVKLTDRLDLNFNVGFERHEFRFSSVTRMGGEPWENINIAAAQAALAYRVSDHWVIYGSPLLNVSAEDSADLDRSLTGGVAFGANYIHDANFNVGFGFGVMSQIEDTVMLFPIIRFNWQFAEQWKLSTGSFTLGVQGGAGLELEWQPCDQLTLAAGVQYQQRRFRLDDENIAPDGIGEEHAIPVYLRLAWTPCENFVVSGFGGVVFGGRLELYDQDGHNITRKDFDPAFVCGARIGMRF